MKKLIILSFALLSLSTAEAQWEPLTSGTTDDLLSVFFSDSNIGYVAGNNGTILKTSDAGDLWSSLVSGTSNTLNSICFTDANNGYVAGDTGTILKTTDGGAIWESQTSGITSNLLSVHFPVADTGYIVGAYGTILKTIDSGVNWVTLNVDSASVLSAVYFIDANTGFALGSRSWGWTNIAYILKTSNGGTDWALSDSISGTILTSIYFVNADTGFVSGYVTGYDGYGLLLKTENGGIDWTTMVISRYVNSICFTDPETGYAVGSYNYMSTNGGFILNTTNNGSDWTYQYFDENIEDLKSIFFTDSNTGYAVGSGGTILKTTNGGTTGVIDHVIRIDLTKIYPNPTNGIVDFQFSIVDGRWVTLKIYDVQGRQMAVVLDEEMTAGEHTVRWDAGRLPAGVYIIQLAVGGRRLAVGGKLVKY